MNYVKDEIIILSDNREFEILKTLNIDSSQYLYLKNINMDQYTIVKVIEDKIYNLTNHELSLVLSNMLARDC